MRQGCYLKHTEGYFNNECLEQVDIDLYFRSEVSGTGSRRSRCVYLFSQHNPPCHKKKTDDALSVDRKIVNPGGKAAKMRDGNMSGNVQKLVLFDGRPKGLKLVPLTDCVHSLLH